MPSWAPGDTGGSGGAGLAGGGMRGGAPGAPGAATGMPGGIGGPRGMPIDFRRLDTSKARLAIEWNFPVYAPDLEQVVEEGRTTSGRAKAALPREKAIYEIRSNSRKPLLVVRECGFCKGTEDALLSRRLNNEKTLLLAKWFHCVKLPNHVLEAEHPFRNLFDGEKPPHLFLCRWDGSEVIPMDGQQTQSDLWTAMEKLIAVDYEEDVTKAVKGLLRCLDAYDSIDSRETEIRQRMEEAIDKDGADTTSVKKLRQKLLRLAEERAQVEAREQALLDLGLMPLPEETPAPDSQKKRS